MSLPDRLRSADVNERLAAIAEIAERGCAAPAALHALAECLGDQRKIIQRRAAEAFRRLAERDAGVADILRAALASPVPRQRWGAAFALSLSGGPHPETLPILFENLGCDDGDVRWAAAGIVVGLHDQPRLVESLCSLLRSGSAEQRKMAAYCLRDLEMHSANVEQALSAALEDSDPAVRMAAMSGLVRLSTDRAVAARRFIGLLTDTDPGVRRAATAALGALGERSEPVVAALHAAAASADAALRRAAERALRLLMS